MGVGGTRYASQKQLASKLHDLLLKSRPAACRSDLCTWVSRDPISASLGDAYVFGAGTTGLGEVVPGRAPLPPRSLTIEYPCAG